MSISAVALERMRNAANPAVPFSSPEACVLLFAYACNADEPTEITDSIGWFVEWGLTLYDPGDVFTLFRTALESLGETNERVWARNNPTMGQDYVILGITTLADLLLEMLFTPDVLGITLTPDTGQRLAVELSEYQSLSWYPVL